MAPTARERLDNAYKAADAYGISKKDIKPVIKQLYKASDNNWGPIEADNYSFLIQTYFEINEKGDDEHRDQKPCKRRHLDEEEDHASSRTESCSELSLRHSSDNGNGRSTSHLASGYGSVHLVGTSASAVPRANHKNNFMTLKKKVSTDHTSVSAQPTSERRRGPLNGARQPELESGAAPITREDKKPHKYISDITKSTENVAISLLDEVGNESLPKFNYIPHNIIYESANLNISLSRIADEDCCMNCSGDCLSSAIPCACARETGGVFVYKPGGLLKDEFLDKRMSPKKQRHVFCQDCPHERNKNAFMPESCKGHLVRDFIKECWQKCGCDMQCGNRVVQRGISCRLQVFWAPQGKGWGVRTLDFLEKGSFVCEYVGEILTNTELYNRNLESKGTGRHTYPVTLEADWGSEKDLGDDEALCLDATFNGNVARFINHRCDDANLVDIPVQVETPDRHYYHVAFFTSREVKAFEELTWDYGINFDEDHPVDAFQCTCGSQYCRDRKRKDTLGLCGEGKVQNFVFGHSGAGRNEHGQLGKNW